MADNSHERDKRNISSIYRDQKNIMSIIAFCMLSLYDFMRVALPFFMITQSPTIYTS